MKEQYRLQNGVPCPPPPPRGRRPGSRDRYFERKLAAIRKGVALVKQGQNYTEAALAIQGEYPRKNTSIKHLAKLIGIECRNQ